MRRSLGCVLLLLGCQSAPAEGSRCTRPVDCGAPLVCAAGRCRAECRESRDCRPDQHCLVDPTTGVAACSLPSDACADRVCAIGFVCVEGECLNACGTIVECPDRLCVEGACIPRRDDAGEPTSDASQPCRGPACDPVVQLDALSTDTTTELAHVCARTRGQHVWCWGNCSAGECGDQVLEHGACGCSGTPIEVLDETGQAMSDATDVAVSASGTCAVRGAEGQLWCWGDGRTVPVRITMADGSPLVGVTDVDAGADHVCVLRGEGTQPLCMGLGSRYRLGTGTSDDALAGMVVASELPPASVLRVEARHTSVLDASGAMISVGANDALDLCATTPTMDAITAVRASTFPPIATFDAHTEWTGAILRDGRLATCGTIATVLGPAPPSPTDCTVGLGACSIGPSYVAVPAGVQLVGLAMGARAALAWDEQGGLWGWGDAVVPSSSELVAIEVGRPVVGAVMYGASDCVLTRDGEVLCVGANDRGMLGRGAPGPAASTLGPVVWP